MIDSKLQKEKELENLNISNSTSKNSSKSMRAVLVIKDQAVQGVYDSEMEAYTDAKKKFELGTFCVPSAKEIDFVPQASENSVIEGGNRQQRREFEARRRKGLI